MLCSKLNLYHVKLCITRGSLGKNKTMNTLILLYFLVFLLSIFFGVIAKKTNFCLLGGVVDILHHNNNGRFYMYFFAIGVAILGASLLEVTSLLNFDNTNPYYRNPQFNWQGYIIGGFIFGFGMTLCRGCGMRSIINLGAGDMRALIAILGIAIAAYTLLYDDVSINYTANNTNHLSSHSSPTNIIQQDLGSLSAYIFGGNIDIWRLIISVSIALLLTFLAFRSSYFRTKRNNIIGGFFIGITIVVVYYLSGGFIGEQAINISKFADNPQYGLGMQSYTFIRPISDILQFLYTPVLYLLSLGLVMIIGIGIGSYLFAIITKNFKWQWFSSSSIALRYFIGGIMLGIGGVFGLGCTIGQGLSGTSTLALGSFLNLFSLLTGVYVGVKLQKRF